MPYESQSRTEPLIEKWMGDIRVQEAAQTFASLIGDRRTILNVGPSWGRDFYYLSRLGKHVINADIAPQFHLENTVLCDAAKCMPFPNQTFQVVLLPEVLEHLIDDAIALNEARRVLCDDGILAISVPFYNDQPDFHVRIHSRRSIERLLRSTGFGIIHYIERGGLITWARLIHGIYKIFRPFISRVRLYRAVINFDYWLDRHARWLIRLSPYYGCYIVAQKASPFDFNTLNVSEFSHSPESKI